MWKLYRLSTNIYGSLLRARKLYQRALVHCLRDRLRNPIFNAWSREKSLPRVLISKWWCCLRYKSHILRKAPSLVWCQLSKEKATLRPEDTGFPGSMGCKILRHMISKCFVTWLCLPVQTRQQLKISSQLSVWAYAHLRFSSRTSEILKQTSKTKQERQKQQQNSSSSLCLVGI